MHDFNRCIPRFLSRFDLVGVVVGVADLERQCVVANVAFDVNTVIDLDAIALFQDRVPGPTFNAFYRVVGGKMSCEVIGVDGSWERRLSTVPVDEPLCGFYDFMEGLSWLKFELHCLEGSTSDMPSICLLYTSPSPRD